MAGSLTDEQKRRRRLDAEMRAAAPVAVEVEVPSALAGFNAADPSAQYIDDPSAVRLNDSYTGQIKYFADLAQRRKTEYDRVKAEEDARVAGARKAAAWTAGAEAAAAIANLAGVGGLGASNQTLPQYSVNWMKTADENYRQRKERLDRIREMQVAAEGQAQAARGQRDIAMLNYSQQQAKLKYDRAMAMEKLRLDNALAAHKISMDEYDRRLKEAEIRVKMETQARKDARDDRVAQSTISRNYAQANKYTSDSRRSSSAGGGAKPLSITFAGTGHEGADETLHFKDKSQIVNVVKANQGVDGIWSEEDTKAVNRILKDVDKSADEKADALIPYARKSPRMMDLLRQATRKNAAKEDKYDTNLSWVK